MAFFPPSPADGDQANVGNIITTNGLFWANGTTALNNYSNVNVQYYEYVISKELPSLFL